MHTGMSGSTLYHDSFFPFIFQQLPYFMKAPYFEVTVTYLLVLFTSSYKDAEFQHVEELHEYRITTYNKYV